MSWNSGFQLRVVEGRQKGLIIPLVEQNYTLGRAAQVGESAPGHIFFMEPTVSRTHAELKWNEKKKQYLMHHRSNTNPTLVEGTPIGKREARPVALGNEIRMGLLVLTMEAMTAPKKTASDLGGINQAMGSSPSREGRLGDKVREPEKAPSMVVGNILEALNNLTEQKTRETAKVNREDVARAQTMHSIESRSMPENRGLDGRPLDNNRGLGGYDRQPESRGLGGGGFERPQENRGLGGYDRQPESRGLGGGGFERPQENRGLGGGGFERPQENRGLGGGGFERPQENRGFERPQAPIPSRVQEVAPQPVRSVSLNSVPPQPAQETAAPDEDNYLERGFDSPEDSPLGFKVVIAQGPDAGQSFSVTDHLMVIGRSVGREDRRHGMGLLLTDETLPTEAAMLVWQSREGSYGLLEAEHNTSPIAVRRVVSGKPVEYGVQPNRPLILQEGDVILMGRSALVLRRTESGGPKKVEAGPPRPSFPQATRPGTAPVTGAGWSKPPSAPPEEEGQDLFRPSRRDSREEESLPEAPTLVNRRSVPLTGLDRNPPPPSPPPVAPAPVENKMPSWVTSAQRKAAQEMPSFDVPSFEAPPAPPPPPVPAPTPELVRPQGMQQSPFRRGEPTPPRGEVPLSADAPTAGVRSQAPDAPVSKLPSVFERARRPAGNLDPSEAPTMGVRMDPSNAPTLAGASVPQVLEPTSRPPEPPPKVSDAGFPATPQRPAESSMAVPKTPASAVPAAAPAGGESRIMDSVPVLSWPWKNSSDFVFDFVSGPNKGCQIALMGSELVDDRTITMGAGNEKSYDVQLESPTGVPLAAVLRYRSGRFGLLNDGHDDSVAVNRFPLKRGDQVVLMTGDRIDIGDTVFRFLERKVVEFLQGYQVNVESGVEQDQDKAFPFFKQRLLIGRGKNCDIRLNDLEVSRIHIALVHRDGKFFIQHRSETNPTFLNGVSLLQGGERLIQPGDRVRLSSLTLLQFGRAEQKRKPITAPSANRPL